ncbi:RNA-binding S4 domain-containing protein [Vibrio sp. S9_S30]|uniref:RNA-binding S4 domain-containing protein n=1 Tax=Vibrio sp. S9_S30 TaxID=2720226 RepID=UPI0016804893|nr:RNA-binding S4 domain-containing protein [Vibrio sp. S9_S30]MBD1556178.1 RNA-binding S4 domain-containing protein [Vibrio sp. S9_S30]
MSEEIEVEALGVEVSSQPIELYKVLKIANVVSGGGEAKYAIAEGYVAVNGELETRKRRKLYDGDLIEFNQEYYVVICDAPVSEPEPKEAKPVKQESRKTRSSNNKETASGNKKSGSANKKSASNKQKNKEQPAEKPAQSPRDQQTGRGSIKF